MPYTQTNIPFINRGLFFCIGQQKYQSTVCNDVVELIPPKKQIIFSKNNTMTKTELLRWASRNKYR